MIRPLALDSSVRGGAVYLAPLCWAELSDAPTREKRSRYCTAYPFHTASRDRSTTSIRTVTATASLHARVPRRTVRGPPPQPYRTRGPVAPRRFAPSPIWL